VRGPGLDGEPAPGRAGWARTAVRSTEVTPLSSALSYPQLKAAVFADRRARVHAVVDGAVVPGLPARLAAADLAGWDCLLRGALPDAAAKAAPYVAELAEASPFTDWLLGEAPAVHPGWGVLLVSHHALLPVREFCRSLAEVILPEGARRRWRWWDPELLAVVLPSCSASQLDEVFALGQQIVVPARTAWTWHALAEGTLATVERPRLATAA
jgi:Domain of unknown function (DUF4123)